MKWSIRNKIALLASLLTLILLLLVAWTSYRYMEHMQREQLEMRLLHVSELLSQDVKAKLSGLMSSAINLAENPLVGNALVDDLGRERYLTQFLHSVTNVQRVPVGVVLTDYSGVPFQSRDGPAMFTPPVPWLKEVIALEGEKAGCYMQNGHTIMAIAEPVYYANTGTVEGAIVLYFSPADLVVSDSLANLLAKRDFDPMRMAVGSSIMLDDCSTSYRHTEPLANQLDRELEVAIATSGVFEPLDIRLQLFFDSRLISEPLQELLRAYLLIGLLLIPMVFILSWFIANRLTLRLNALRSAASDIAVQRVFDRRLPVLPKSESEVRELTEAFNRVLVSLGDAVDLARTSEQRLSSHIEATPVGVVTTDELFLVQQWNGAAERIFGVERSKAIGQPVTKLVFAPSIDITALFESEITQPDQRYLHLTHSRPDGEEVDCEWHISRLSRGDGYGILVQDISAESRAAAAERANRAKSAFLANMSHELRTPLNAMLGYAQIMLRDDSLNERQHHAIETIKRSGDHLITMINDVLDLAKIEAGQFDLSPSPCELRQFFVGLDQLFSIRAREKGVSFSSSLSPGLPEVVELDEKRLRQVVMNLLGNAIKFTEQGEVELIAQYQAGELLITISDSGIGIAQDQQAELFRPFQQAGSREYRSQGTGLGLSISKNLITQMQGSIEVESEVGQGSIFTVRLPVRVLSQGLSDGHSGRRSPERIHGYRRLDGRTAPLRLLIADDVEDNRQVLTSLLQPLNFEVMEARDGQESVEMSMSQHPDLILMDLVMPNLSGIEAVRQIVSRSASPSPLIVACSASAYEEDILSSLEAGCVDHIAKPVQVERLFEVLEHHLPLEWFGNSDVPDVTGETDEQAGGLEPKLIEEMDALIRLGKIVPLQELIAQQRQHYPNSRILKAIQVRAKRFDLKGVRQLMEGKHTQAT